MIQVQVTGAGRLSGSELPARDLHSSLWHSLPGGFWGCIKNPVDALINYYEHTTEMCSLTVREAQNLTLSYPQSHSSSGSSRGGETYSLPLPISAGHQKLVFLASGFITSISASMVIKIVLIYREHVLRPLVDA